MAERKRLIDATVAKRIMDDCVLWETDEVETAKTCIDLTPTVDAVEVVHGEWIECEGTVCSVCNKHFFTDGPLAVANYRAKYCPNCGAKMDGGDINAG